MAIGLPNPPPSLPGRVPRLVYRRVLLSRQRWTVDINDIRSLIGTTDSVAAVQALRVRLNLPRHVLFGSGDNQIVFDLDNPISVRDWLKRAHGDLVTIEEAFPRGYTPWLRSLEGHHACSYVVPIKRTGRMIEWASPTSKSLVLDSPRFLPGSEWTSVKIYTGAHARELVAASVLPKVIATFGEGASWFFLRYADPATHLRFRVRGEGLDFLHKLRGLLYDVLGSRLVSRVELDVYVPESHRYGGIAAVSLVERLFHIDSTIAIDALARGPMSSSDRCDYCVAAVEAYFNAFELPGHARLPLLRRMGQNMYDELRVQPATRAKVGLQFRDKRRHLASVRGRWSERFGRLLEQGAHEIAELKRLDEAGLLTVTLHSIICSLIHMSINRILIAYSREQEAMVYDWSHRLEMEHMARTEAQHSMTVSSE